MKINIADPTTGGQKLFDIDDEKKLRIFYEKRIAQEVDATPLGDSFKGYILRITGGNDKQGFPMKQGVLVSGRVRVLLDGTTGCFRRPTHDGERKRRTVRGCICGSDLSVINTIIVKKGPAHIEGVTDKSIPRRLGPKRASKIRRLFNLSKKDDVRKYVVRRTLNTKKAGKKGTERSKAPKIQRLVTPLTLQRKKQRMQAKKKAGEKARAELIAYRCMLRDRKMAARAARKGEKAARYAKILAQRRAETQKMTKRVLRKIAERARYAEKVKAHALVSGISRKQRYQGRRFHMKVVAHRKQLCKVLAVMRLKVKAMVQRAKKQVNLFPNSKKAVHDLRRFKREHHELYLRIMSGGRAPNLHRLAGQIKRRRVAKLKEHTRLMAKASRHAAVVRRVAQRERRAAAAARYAAKKAKN